MTQKRIPPAFSLIFLMIGMATVMIFILWFRHLTLLFGNHMVSIVTTLTAMLFCLATGSYITGKIADRLKHPLTIAIAFLIIISLYALLEPLLLKLITKLFLQLNNQYDPGSFGTGLLRFILSFLILLIPLALIAGLWPLLVRHFIRHVSQSGKYMSAVIWWMITGILTGLALSFSVIIPLSGFSALNYAGAALFLGAALPAFLYQFKHRKKNVVQNLTPGYEKPRKSIRFRKKRIVLEASAKITRAMLYGSAFQAFIFGSTFIVSYRILIQYSVVQSGYFFLMLISTALAGIAVGSILYRIVAERPANKYLTLATLQILSGFGSLISYALLNLSAGYIYQRLREAESGVSLFAAHGLLMVLFIFIPTVLYGMSIPLAGKLYPKRLQQIGSAFGRLGRLFFLNLLAGIIITPYILIPLLGVQTAYFLLALMMFLSGIYLVSRDSRLIRGFRVGYAMAAILLFVTTAGLFRMHYIHQLNRSDQQIIEGSKASVIAVWNNDSTRSVFVNGDYYFGTDINSRKEQISSACLPILLNNHIKSAMVIGFGTGLTAATLNRLGVPDILISDRYPEVIRLSTLVFSDVNDDIITAESVEFRMEDARSHLFRTKDTYDLITSGLDHFEIIPGIYTSEFYRQCFNKLSDQGILCQVIPVQNISRHTFLSLCKSSMSVFHHVSLWHISAEKVLLISSKSSQQLDYCMLTSAFSVMPVSSVLHGIDIPDPETLVAQYIMSEYQLSALNFNAEENTDNRPVNEWKIEKTPMDTTLVPLLQSEVDYHQMIHFNGRCAADTAMIIRQIKLRRESILRQVSLSSSIPRKHVDGFFEWTSSLIQLYL